MTRWIVCTGLVLVVACKKDRAAPAAVTEGPGSGSESGSGSDLAIGSGMGSAGSAAPIEPDLEDSEQAVATAFGGAAKVPMLPLLAKDGATVAINVSDGPDLADFGSFEVGFLDASGKVDKAVVMTLDEALAIEEAYDPAEGVKPKPDPAKLAANALALSKRLADGGYTAFEHELRTEDDKGTVALGGAGTLEFTDPPEDLSTDLPGVGSLKLRLVDASGKQLQKETVKAIKAKRDALGDCGAEPGLGHVWYDGPRKRVLVQIGYNSGGDTCREYPLAYRLWALP